MDSFFRARVFLVFAVLCVAFGLLASITSTKSMAETGRISVTGINDQMPIEHLIGTSVDPMDTMGAGADTPNGTSAPAFATDISQSS